MLCRLGVDPSILSLGQSDRSTSVRSISMTHQSDGISICTWLSEPNAFQLVVTRDEGGQCRRCDCEL